MEVALLNHPIVNAYKEFLWKLGINASRYKVLSEYLLRKLMRKGYSVTGEQFDVIVSLWDNDGQHQQQIYRQNIPKVIFQFPQKIALYFH